MKINCFISLQFWVKCVPKHYLYIQIFNGNNKNVNLCFQFLFTRFIESFIFKDRYLALATE
jgi:hypothetical protein